jgi:hypothetical protein
MRVDPAANDKMRTLSGFNVYIENTAAKFYRHYSHLQGGESA